MTGFEIFAAVGAISSLASGVVGAMGAQAQAEATANAAEYNAMLAERNRKIIENQASADQMDKAIESKRQLGMIRAAYGASGIDPVGSPLDVLEDTAQEQELDIRRIGYEGTLRGMEQTERANLYRMEAESARKSGSIAAIGSIIGGIGGAARGFGGRAGTSLLQN